MRAFLSLGILLLTLMSCGTDDSVREPILVEEHFSSNLFFSEYVEGTSFNKALEIVNLTGETIDLELEGYSIKKQANGAGSWMGEMFLTGTVYHNEVFVIANESSTHPDIINAAHQLKAGAPMDFNGNDPIGLFQNGVLIDVIGEVDNNMDFAKDVTLRRMPEVTEPSNTYNPGEWELLEVDDVTGLGSY